MTLGEMTLGKTPLGKTMFGKPSLYHNNLVTLLKNLKF
jgi:hypothetical protein